MGRREEVGGSGRLRQVPKRKSPFKKGIVPFPVTSERRVAAAMKMSVNMHSRSSRKNTEGKKISVKVKKKQKIVLERRDLVSYARNNARIMRR